MPRKTTRKTTTRVSAKKTIPKNKSKKAGRSPRITSNQAKSFGSFLKELYSDE